MCYYIWHFTNICCQKVLTFYWDSLYSKQQVKHLKQSTCISKQRVAGWTFKGTYRDCKWNIKLSTVDSRRDIDSKLSTVDSRWDTVGLRQHVHPREHIPGNTSPFLSHNINAEYGAVHKIVGLGLGLLPFALENSWRNWQTTIPMLFHN